MEFRTLHIPSAVQLRTLRCGPAHADGARHGCKELIHSTNFVTHAIHLRRITRNTSILVHGMQLRNLGEHGGAQHGCEQTCVQQLIIYIVADEETTNVEGTFGTILLAPLWI